MAVKSKETLKTQSSETFYDNDLGGITPADHRQFNEDLIDSMATVAQGNKADTAIQGVRVSGSFLPTTTVGGKNIIDWSNGPATAAQGKKADTAIQAATIGGAAVTKSGTTLQLPAYPAEVKVTELTAAQTFVSVSHSLLMYFGVVENAFLLFGSYSRKNVSANMPIQIKISNVPTEYLTRMTYAVPIECVVAVMDQASETIEMKKGIVSKNESELTISVRATKTAGNKTVFVNSLIIRLN